MVSKLNVNPFQRVNSPDEAPVTNLRPSGVQAMQNIGHLILLVAAFTKRVVTALIALSSYAGGGWSSGKYVTSGCNARLSLKSRCQTRALKQHSYTMNMKFSFTNSTYYKYK